MFYIVDGRCLDDRQLLLKFDKIGKFLYNKYIIKEVLYMTFSKNRVKLYCDASVFPEIEMFLFGQEWTEKPSIDYIDIETGYEIYSYRIMREGDKYYIVVD